MILSFHGLTPWGRVAGAKLTIHHHLEPRLTMRVITLTYPHTSSKRGVCLRTGQKNERGRNLLRIAQLFFGSNNRAFYRIRMFITVLTTARHWSLPRSSTFACHFLKSPSYTQRFLSPAHKLPPSQFSVQVFRLILQALLICPYPRFSVPFHNMLRFYGKELLAPHQILQAEGPPPVGRRDSLFNIFALHSIT
jgi:hypothetical protein